MTEALTKAQEPSQAHPTLRFIYRNWRGEIAERRVRPLTIWYGRSPWHAGEQWFMAAIDDENGNRRDFAMAEILTFEPTRAALATKENSNAV